MRVKTNTNLYDQRSFLKNAEFRNFYLGVNKLPNISLQVGDLVQISYLGASTIEKGKFKGKESHQFRIILGD